MGVSTACGSGWMLRFSTSCTHVWRSDVSTACGSGWMLRFSTSCTHVWRSDVSTAYGSGWMLRLALRALTSGAVMSVPPAVAGGCFAFSLGDAKDSAFSEINREPQSR
jgi:hypothetical protein